MSNRENLFLQIDKIRKLQLKSKVICVKQKSQLWVKQIVVLLITTISAINSALK